MCIGSQVTHTKRQRSLGDFSQQVTVVTGKKVEKKKREEKG
jgi:hypothetical protein